MDLREIADSGFENAYNLRVPNYDFVVRHLGRKKYGYTDVKKKQIVLNSDYMSNYNEFITTLFHESAHAITFELFGYEGHSLWFYKFYEKAMGALL